LLNKLTPDERIDAFANRPILRQIYERFTGYEAKGTPPPLRAGLGIEDVSKLPKGKGEIPK